MRSVRRNLVPPLLAIALTGCVDSGGSRESEVVPARKRNADDMWLTPRGSLQLPAGVEHADYWSPSMSRRIGFAAYLPPSYHTDRERRFPAIYHLHESYRNELSELDVAELLHQGIVDGKWPEMMLVFPNGGRATMYQDSADGRFLAETTVIRELIPHIDATYRTIADRRGRAIEGSSMGGRGATFLAFKYPDLFVSLFNQAGNTLHTTELGRTVSADSWPANYLGRETARLRENDPYWFLDKNIDQIRALHIRIMLGTDDRGHRKSVRELHAELRARRIDHTYLEIRNVAHNRIRLMAPYRHVWFDHHAAAFGLGRQAAR